VSVDGSVHHSGSTPETLTELVLAQIRLLRTLLAPMPRIGEVNLARIVAEVGPHPGACRHRRAGHRRVRRRPGHQGLRQDQDVGSAGPPSCMPMPAGAASTTHAIRILARAWLRVIWACWHTDTAYNPARHRAEQRLTA
jgi:hypothetical protein